MVGDLCNILSAIKCNNKHYKNKYKQKYSNNNNETAMFTFIKISRKGSHEHQEHESDCLHCDIKSKVKQATKSVKFQSVLCEDKVCLKRVIVVWRFPLQIICQIIDYTTNFYYLCKKECKEVLQTK